MSFPDGARATLAAHLVDVLVDVDVWPSPRVAVVAQRPAVIIAIRQTVNADIACPSRRGLLDLWVVTPRVDDTGGADDDVDKTLGLVLDALDIAPRTSWSTATRDVWAESQPCYRIEIEVLP